MSTASVAAPLAGSAETLPLPLRASGSPISRKIMIVDDEMINVKVVRKYLSGEGYDDFLVTTHGGEVLPLLERHRPDLLLLDIVMPGINGLEVLRDIRADVRWTDLPVLILSASDDRETRLSALNLGATDFLAKPVDPTDLVPRVRNALVVKAHHEHIKTYAGELERKVAERTAELAASRLEVIHCLARAAEFRDNETGRHVIRVGRYVGVIARQLGLEPRLVELMEHAAPLHDMGKIGIPDEILRKPGKLNPDEFEVMQRHCVLGKRTFEPMSPEEWSCFKRHTFLGEDILNASTSPLIEMAATIALTHHERWDGRGYPLGLSGTDIPLEGRVTAVADVFDALASKRPYKAAFPLDRCFEILEQERGTHFDPTVLDAFVARREEIVRVMIECMDLD